MNPPCFKATVPIIVALCLSACVKLDGLAAYSAASSATMASPVIIEAIPATVERRNYYRDGGGKALDDARANSKRLEKIQGVYRSYFLALGALANKDITEYKNQFGAFEKSLGGSGLATAEEVSAISKLLGGVVGMGTDVYRQKTVAKLVKAVDPTLQRGVKELRKINANYRVSLRREDAASQAAMEESLAAGAALDPPQPPYLVRGVRAHQEGIIRNAEKKSESFDKAVAAIADGHTTLLRDSRNLRGDEAFKNLKPKIDAIVDAYKEISK